MNVRHNTPLCRQTRLRKPVNPELLRCLLRYEPTTGRLIWKRRDVSLFSSGQQSAEVNARKWNTKHAGREAFTSVDNYGYRQGRVFDQHYRAHRVIWAMTFGEWPAADIDHIDGNGVNNRIENLRCVAHLENGRNQRVPKNNTSGAIGVSLAPRTSKWRARIKVDGRDVHLGHFDDLQAAISARKAAERRFCFHENHGRTAP